MSGGEPARPDAARAGDPFAELARVREAGRAHRVARSNGDKVWLVSRYDDVRALLADPRLSLSKDNSTDGYQSFGLPPALDRNLLNLDPPDHTRLRRLVSSAFTARRVEALRPRIQAAASQLLDVAVPKGRFDVIADFAAPLPITVICELLGVPDEQGAVFRTWTTDLLSPGPDGSAKAAVAVKNLCAMMLDLIAGKRARPGDDLISALLAARDGADKLTEDELVSLVFLLLLAGFENTVNFLGNAVLRLLDHPEAAARLRAEPAADTPLTAAAIEELLRLDSPALLAIRRFPTEDVALGDTRLPRGHTVMLVTGAANRDPAAFPDPDRLEIDRATAGAAAAHVSLGHGPHFCLGAALARAEAQIAIWTLLRRCPGLSLAVPREDIRWRVDLRQRAVVELPVTSQAAVG